MPLTPVTAKNALEIAAAGDFALIDVRSEREFAQGAIGGFVNAPILIDDERHQVGLTYKERGPAAAMEVGERLVGPHREERLAHWVALASASASGEAVVACWRGGLRSEIATEWLTSRCRARRVEGGYKALRRELLPFLSSPPPMIVVAGLTGSGKTELLQSLTGVERVDVEALACHRGSAFGAYPGRGQPSQGTFDNALAAAFRRARGPVFVEDESAAIGSLHLPPLVRQQMLASAVVYLEAPLETRVARVFAEYLAAPLAGGEPLAELRSSVVASLGKLRKRLGGALAQTLEAEVDQAFTGGGLDLQPHAGWIAKLLTQYYDRSYTYGYAQAKRRELFRGNLEECRQWILQKYG